MIEIPESEPTQFTAGDTVKWTLAPSNYLSTDGWTIEWVFVRAGTQKTVEGVGQADGSHLATIAADASSWPAGSYRWQKLAKKDGERYTIEAGETEVLADYAAASDGLDDRSPAERALEAVENVLFRRAGADDLSMTIETARGSRTVASIPHSELWGLRSKLRSEVAREKKAARLAKGLGTSRILVRFGGMR